MAYRINDNCINCGACRQVCPIECIEETENIHVIDEEKCISCGACADVCPVDAPHEA